MPNRRTAVSTEADTVRVDKGIYYYHGDHLGSSSVVTDRSGGFYEHLEYFPYGEVWVNERVSADAESVPYKYTGKEQDPETGLYYHGARYYDSVLCRWISTDPALEKYMPRPNDFDTEHDYFWYLTNDKSQKLPGIGGVFNAVNLDMYHYAGNNPVKFVDPDGLYTIFVDLPVDRNKTATMYLYNDSGKLVGIYTILAKGQHDNKLEQNGDTPSGIFEIVDRGEYSENDSNYDTYGPMFLALDPLLGEAKDAKDNGRGIPTSRGGSGRFGIHAGKERGRQGVDPQSLGGLLSSTLGCLRGGNKDIKDIQDKIKEMEKQRGHRTGQDPKIKDYLFVKKNLLDLDSK